MFMFQGYKIDLYEGVLVLNMSISGVQNWFVWGRRDYHCNWWPFW